MGDDTIMVELMDSPEDVKLVIRSLSHRVTALELRCDDQQTEIDENKRITAPLRWIFNKVMVGVGLVIVASILAWLGMDL